MSLIPNNQVPGNVIKTAANAHVIHATDLLMTTNANVVLPPTAILGCVSTTQGFLPPAMTSTQRDAITLPTEGICIYNLTTHKLNFYNGSAWAAVTSV